MRAWTADLALPGSVEPGPPALVVRAVRKAFRAAGAELDALRSLSLSVGRGELVCLVGPSGCGKSTLLRLAAGLLEPTEGAIEVQGQPPDAARRGKRIGYVPQEAALLPWRTALGNVALALEVNPRPAQGDAGPAAEAALRRVGLGGFERHYPHQLSVGMRQRVALARALVLEPSLMLLDEPFAALDELTREAMRYELLSLWSRDRPAVLFVTHSVAEAVALAERVLVLSARPGRVDGEVLIRLPRPRTPEMERSPAFLAAEDQVRALLRPT